MPAAVSRHLPSPAGAPASGSPHSAQNLEPARAFVPQRAQKRAPIGPFDCNENPYHVLAASNL